MTVRADPQNLDVDAATLLDPLFVPGTERRIVAGVARRNVDVLLRHVHVLEEILVHEVVITLRMARSQANILVQVERRHLREVQSLLAVHAHQLLVQAKRRGTGGHSQHGVRLRVQQASHFLSGHTAHLFIRRLDDDFHLLSTSRQFTGSQHAGASAPACGAHAPTSRSWNDLRCGDGFHRRTTSIRLATLPERPCPGQTIELGSIVRARAPADGQSPGRPRRLPRFPTAYRARSSRQDPAIQGVCRSLFARLPRSGGVGLRLPQAQLLKPPSRSAPD